MTTNYSESVNNIFKGVRSRLVSGIIEYSFEKCNAYFVNRWQKARDLLDKGGKIGSFADDIMYDAALRSVNQSSQPYGPNRMIYSIQGSSILMLEGRVMAVDTIELPFGPVLAPVTVLNCCIFLVLT
jgi:hypothetical protein